MNDLVIVLDNAPAHSRAEDVVQEEEFATVAFCRLAPYSPMLNPIEHVWSSTKESIKEQIQATFDILAAGDQTGLLTQHEFRLRYLEECADRAMNGIDAGICIRSYNYVQLHYPAVMHLEDMNPGI